MSYAGTAPSLIFLCLSRTLRVSEMSQGNVASCPEIKTLYATLSEENFRIRRILLETKRIIKGSARAQSGKNTKRTNNNK